MGVGRWVCGLGVLTVIAGFGVVGWGQVAVKEPAPVVRTAAGHIVKDAFAGDAMLGPTLVSLNLDKVGWRAAMDELGRQAGVTYTYNLPAKWEAAVSLKLEREPYLEALREIAVQGGIHVHPMPCPSVRPVRGNTLQSTNGNLPATVWCVSGPFSFVLRSIEHEVDLPGPGERMRMELMLDSEPKVHVLAWPRGVEGMEAEDELGHSLVPLRVKQPWEKEIPKEKADALPGWSDPRSYYMSIPLGIPKEGLGKRIAKFKAKAPYWIQSRTEMVEVENPTTAGPMVREIGGVEVTVSMMEHKGDSWEMQLSYKRTTLAAGEWAERSFALSAIRPMVEMEGGEWKWAMENDYKLKRKTASDTEDSASRTYKVYAPERADVQVPVKVVVAVPLEVKRVLVPVEFKDLPLP